MLTLIETPKSGHRLSGLAAVHSNQLLYRAKSIEAMATDPIHKYLLTNLEARKKLCEMEYAALVRVIESPRTQPFERGAALERRDVLMREWAKIAENLDLLDYDPPAKPVGAGETRDPNCGPRKSWNS